MDSQPSIRMDQTIVGIDIVAANYLLPEGVPTSPQDFNYFSHGLCQPWLEIGFGDSAPTLLRQYELNSRKSPPIHSSNRFPITLPCITSATSNGCKEELDVSPVPFGHYSTSIESTHISPEPIFLDSFSTDLSTSTFCDVSFAVFDFSSESIPLDAFSTDSSSDSNRDASYTESNLPCSPVHPPSSPAPVDTHQFPYQGNISNSTPSSATLISRRPRSRPGDLRKQRRKIEQPEICPICNKGHAYKRDLMRHIKSNHKDLAKVIGMPLEKIKCKHLSCSRTFERNDHLTRHMKGAHNTR
ncbi:hypothetical protein EDB81DRAFT_154405 [Dactylonectria macrodidyma]|uniref:C2H2-type domain-containing protein n=1 Tax=Dactylonectria macrodidyma TaxID=307937 RepID=A0A9P9JNW2_9HYPO|nr:hypothetical protein EDB81DRAFT_154405 [Dactylonectria macrodidyma]